MLYTDVKPPGVTGGLKPVVVQFLSVDNAVNTAFGKDILLKVVWDVLRLQGFATHMADAEPGVKWGGTIILTNAHAKAERDAINVSTAFGQQCPGEAIKIVKANIHEWNFPLANGDQVVRDGEVK